MAQVNTCLKRIFTIFNIFFAIIGGFIILLTLLIQIMTNISGGESLEGRIYSLVILYVVGAVTMVVAILGAHGAHKESRGCMIAFLVCMVTGTLLMLRVGIPASIVRPKLEGILEDRFHHLLPLDKASNEVKVVAESMQTELHCCGLFSYTDWGNNIPKSCKCNPVEVEEGMCQTVNYQDFFMLPGTSVYSKPCSPIIIYYFQLISDIAIGIIFTLAVLALLGLILSSIIIHQMRYSIRPNVLLTVPTVFTPSPPKYQELHNPPPPYC